MPGGGESRHRAAPACWGRGLAALRGALSTALAPPGSSLDSACEAVTQVLRQRGEDDIALVRARIRQ